MPAKDAAREVYFPDRAALRAWLEEHHRSHPPIWLVYDKKGALGNGAGGRGASGNGAGGRPASGRGASRALTYDDIVEEALCFGWIDSVAGRVDERRAKLYFSARKPGSVWSAVNKQRLEKLEREGLLRPAGIAKIEAAKADGSWTALDAVEALQEPAELRRALDADGAARRNFDAMPRGARKQFLYWLSSAKRENTRAARIAEIVRMCRENRRRS